MIKTIGLGAGGHAAVMIEAIRAQGLCEIVGLLDVDSRRHGTHVLDVPVLGDDRLLSRLIGEGITHFFNGIGSVRDTSLRSDVFERAITLGYHPIDVVHPSAVISPSASWSEGVVILARAVVATRAELGRNVLLNTNAIVEHDCMIGDHTHIATGAILAGAVRLGRGVHVGAGAVVRQGCTIGDRAVIGAGAVVIRDVEAASVVVGVPAKRMVPR